MTNHQRPKISISTHSIWDVGDHQLITITHVPSAVEHLKTIFFLEHVCGPGRTNNTAMSVTEIQWQAVRQK